MIEFVLMDIEGTTTSIGFVHNELFPYASENLSAFVAEQQSTPKVQAVLASVKETALEEGLGKISNEEAVALMHSWIKADRKHTALKTLQGYLWRRGYEKGDYEGHIYPDVVPVWDRWKALGISLGIYSSGSVEAQKLLFSYSDYGDLTPYLDAYFDTKVGHKREVSSYLAIQSVLQVPAEQILFLSDVEAELDAALAAGFQVTQIVRNGTEPSLKHTLALDFEECFALHRS